jgi:hypothetical protein
MPNYPSSLDTYTPVDGTTLLSSGHAALHNTHGSIAVAIETTVGTTAGTNVLKSFSAGDMAARVNGETFGTPTLNTPKIGTAILDANGNEVFLTPATSSAVNEITVANAATNTSPYFAATGGDTNIDLKLYPKGTGEVKIFGANQEWIWETHTWTYASASSFTIAGVDLTYIYTKGTRLAWVEGSTGKYGVVTSSSFSTNTTVNIAVNTDYVITNTTLANNRFSHAANPAGYPTWFNSTPVFTGFSADPTNIVNRFSVSGNTVMWSHRELTDGTSNATGFTISAPITAVTITNMVWNAPTTVVDNGSVVTAAGYASLASAGTAANVYKDWGFTAFTNANGKRAAGFTILYEI